MDQQQHYVGLDVSLQTTSICVIDDKGTAVWRGKCASTPEAITEAVHTYAPAAVRIGLETGRIARWASDAPAMVVVTLRTKTATAGDFLGEIGLAVGSAAHVHICEIRELNPAEARQLANESTRPA